MSRNCKVEIRLRGKLVRSVIRLAAHEAQAYAEAYNACGGNLAVVVYPSARAMRAAKAAFRSA